LLRHLRYDCHVTVGSSKNSGGIICGSNCSCFSFTYRIYSVYRFLLGFCLSPLEVLSVPCRQILLVFFFVVFVRVVLLLRTGPIYCMLRVFVQFEHMMSSHDRPLVVNFRIKYVLLYSNFCSTISTYVPVQLLNIFFAPKFLQYVDTAFACRCRVRLLDNSLSQLCRVPSVAFGRS